LDNFDYKMDDQEELDDNDENEFYDEKKEGSLNMDLS